MIEPDIQSSIAIPLAMLIFVLEKQNALWTYFNLPQGKFQQEWQNLFGDSKIIGIISPFTLLISHLHSTFAPYQVSPLQARRYSIHYGTQRI